MKKLSLLLIVLLSAQVMAQQNLPKELTADERRIMDDYYSNYNFGRGITTAPGGSIRCAAEWEEVQTVVITWTGQYNSIHSQIVDAAQEECLVLIACSDSNSVKSTLQSNNVPLTNLAFLEIDYNSVWIRDYGGNTMYRNDVDSLFLVDWIYNRPRPDDDVMPEFHAQFHNIPIYTTTAAPADLVNTGGNWMSDGFGTAFASELIIEENEPGNPYSVTAKTESEIDQIMTDYQGISRYIKMPVLPYDNIHHIDMHMKLLDEETLLVSEYPQGVADGPQIEANLQYVLNNFNSMFGTPYQVIRITVPPSTGGAYPDNGGYYRTYANNVFINKTVIVPYYREEYDTVAYRVLKEALPGYTIVGIDVDNPGQNLIASSGAIHCITHTVGVDDPLLISHQPLEDTYDDINPYTVNAYFKHASGVTNATLYYTTDTLQPYTSVPMNFVSGNNWTANIPAQAAGTEIFYYVHGEATNGKQQVRPITAPDGFWRFKVLEPVSVNELENEGVTLNDIFPNPASAITCIPLISKVGSSGRIVLRDITGKEIKEIYQGEIPMGESKYFIFANEYAAGSYLVTVELETITLTKKVMIR